MPNTKPSRSASRCWLAILLAALTGTAQAQTGTNTFTYAPAPVTPPASRPGMFVGAIGDTTVVGGGLDTNGRPSSEVAVLPAGQTAWMSFKLAVPVAYTAATTAILESDGRSRLYLVGGLSTNGLTDAVQVLDWQAGQLQETELPPLPAPLALAGAGAFADQTERQLYVAGGTTSVRADSVSDRLFRYMSGQGWQELPAEPHGGSLLPAIICFYNDVHVLGGFTVTAGPGSNHYAPSNRAMAYRWKVIDGTTDRGWRTNTPVPVAVAAPVAFMTGQVHAGVAGGYAGPATGNLLDGHWDAPLTDAVNVYHDVTDTWVDKGHLPAPLAAGAVLSQGPVLRMLGTSGPGRSVAYDVTIHRTVKSLRWLDYTGLLVYFGVVAFVGIYFTRKQSGSEGFALGDRKIPWWMAGISMFASAASSISFMAIPALAFRTSLLWALPALVLIPMFFLEAYVLYPLIRKLEITSTFEYLERRFHPSLRYVASAQAIALQTFGRMNMVLLLPALAIAAVTGLNVYASVLLMGVVTTIYSAKGGMKAVVLTEVIQGLTMVVGISLIIILAITGLPHGMRSLIEVDSHFHKFNLGIWSLDYTMPIIWILILTPFFNKLAFSADQPTVQRVFATPLKDVRKLALMFLCFSVFISFAVNFAGISVFAYFHQHPVELDPAMTNDQVIPLYIVQRLPVGIAGLIIASLFAAAMSALAGSMNSVAILFTEDFYRKVKKEATDAQRLRVMRLASLVAGTAATLCALYMAELNQRSLFQTWNELFALLGGGFLGIYILGTYTRRANAIGAFTGALCSIGVTVCLRHYTAVHWYFYTPGSVMACVAIGYLVSLCTPPPRHSLAGLTVFDVKTEKLATSGNPKKA